MYSRSLFYRDYSHYVNLRATTRVRSPFCFRTNYIPLEQVLLTAPRSKLKRSEKRDNQVSLVITDIIRVLLPCMIMLLSLWGILCISVNSIQRNLGIGTFKRIPGSRLNMSRHECHKAVHLMC